MRKRTRVPAMVLIMVLCSLMLCLEGAPAPIRAAPPSPDIQLGMLAPHQNDPLEDGYLIPLPFPSLDEMQIPTGLTEERAVAYARSLSYRMAAPLRVELERLRKENKIAGFEVRPELHAIAVQTTQPDALTGLANAGALVPEGAKGPPACVSSAAPALAEQVTALSRQAENTLADARVAGGGGGTNPSIRAYVNPGFDYTSIGGYADARTRVDLRLLRGSSVIFTTSTTSASDGYYWFSPSWHLCPSSGYDWKLLPGDVVEATSGGNTVQTVVAPLSVWIDPTTDIVSGTTKAGRRVQIELYDFGKDACSSTTYCEWADADSSGRFGAAFGDEVDFDRRAYARVRAHDAGDNYTYAYFYAHRIGVDLNGYEFYGRLDPSVSFTATLSREGSVLSTYAGTSNAKGRFYGSFSYRIRAGDVIAVSNGGVSLHYTVADMDVVLDPTTDLATGTTGAGRRVQAYFYRGDSQYVQTTCDYGWSCASATADGAGAFTLNAGMDLARGDYASMYVYDAAGNYQYSHRNVPAIVARLSHGDVAGYWSDPKVRYVRIVLKDSEGTAKESTRWGWVDELDGEFDYDPSSDIVPGDTVEVGDGTITETMQVRNLSARLSGSTQRLAGSAYNGRLLAELWDFDRNTEVGSTRCVESTVTGGTYSLSFAEARVGAWDDADIWNAGPDGHYTHRLARALSVAAVIGDDHVSGYTETPDAQVQVTLERGGSPIATYSGTSGFDGYYSGQLSDGVTVEIAQGDRVRVQTGDGSSASLLIPALTVNEDIANNRLYGASPAGQPVRPTLRRHDEDWWGGDSHLRIVTADAQGTYSAGFGGLYWWEDCSVFSVGDNCTQAGVYYYDASDHEILMKGPPPLPVGADAYESDDTPDTASTYSGIQSHTFHKRFDVDWVAFAVSSEDVASNATFFLETVDLGWGTYTSLCLYDTDGDTQLSCRYPGTGASRLQWTPSVSGTYYARVQGGYRAHCDTSYKLFIYRSRVYLPIVHKVY